MTALFLVVVCAGGDGLPTLCGDRRWLPTRGGTAHRVVVTLEERSVACPDPAELRSLQSSSLTGRGPVMVSGPGACPHDLVGLLGLIRIQGHRVPAC